MERRDSDTGEARAPPIPWSEGEDECDGSGDKGGVITMERV